MLNPILVNLFIFLAVLWIAFAIFLVITKKKGLWGVHQINYRHVDDMELLNQASISVPVTITDIDYVYTKRHITEKWVLNIGKALDSIVKSVPNETAKQASIFVKIKDINVPEFHRGFWIWSGHSVTVSFTYEIISNEEVLKSGQIQETGNEQGDMTLMPVFGQKKYNMGIEIAMSRALLKCLGTLHQQIQSYV